MNLLEHQAEIFKQFAFISSLLAGFSFSIIYGLVSSEDKRRRVEWILGILLLASSTLLASTFISSIVVISSGGLIAEPEYLKAVNQTASIATYLFYIGALAFLVGIGLSGWLRSCIIGLISTLLAICCAILMLFAIRILFIL